MPVALRAYLTHELGVSSHAVLREAVPLLLLDPEPEVRQAAAAVLDQLASPRTFSPVKLRRTLLLRNWIPELERPAIDRLVRKARVKGVACARWTAAPVLSKRCTIVGGSRAQSVVLTMPSGRSGLFAGLLLEQGFGVRDAWCNLSVPRREMNRSLQEARCEMAWRMTGRDHLDRLCSIISRRVSLWDICRSCRLLRLPRQSGQRTGKTAASTGRRRRGGVQELVDSRPRLKLDVALRRMSDEVLPARREAWAERLVLLALWLRDSTESILPAELWQNCGLLARELLAGRPLAALPAMVEIAERSRFVARVQARYDAIANETVQRAARAGADFVLATLWRAALIHAGA